MSNPNTTEEIEITAEDLLKINSVAGKATYNDYHWWNLIGIIKNLMQDHTTQTVDRLKEKAREIEQILSHKKKIDSRENPVYFPTDKKIHNKIKDILQLIEEVSDE